MTRKVETILPEMSSMHLLRFGAVQLPQFTSFHSLDTVVGLRRVLLATDIQLKYCLFNPFHFAPKSLQNE